MANIKSAKKRILQSNNKSEVNRNRRSKLRSKIKSILQKVTDNNSKDAKKLFLELEPSNYVPRCPQKQ